MSKLDVRAKQFQVWFKFSNEIPTKLFIQNIN